MLQHKSNNIDLYNRTPRSQIQVTYANSTFQKSIDISNYPKQGKLYSLLILCLKEHQILDAIIEWKSLISKDTHVLIIRNGINHIHQVKEFFESNTITPAIIDCPTQPFNDGYLQLQEAIVTIPSSPQQESVIEIFQETNIKIKTSKNFHHDSWVKLCVSASLGATQCRYNGTCSIFESDNVVMYFFELLMESIAIANADNANITKIEIQSMLLEAEQYPPNKGSSMLSDFQARKPLELGAKNGAIVSVAKRLKRPAIRNIAFLDWLSSNTKNRQT